MLWRDLGDNPATKSKIFIGPMVIISFFVIFGFKKLENDYKTSELNSYGVNAIATVIGFETERYRRGSTKYAIFTYFLNNKKYTQSIAVYSKEYKLNQDFEIKISTKNPELFEVIEYN